jgi:hypothetical protein
MRGGHVLEAHSTGNQRGARLFEHGSVVLLLVTLTDFSRSANRCLQSQMPQQSKLEDHASEDAFKGRICMAHSSHAAALLLGLWESGKNGHYIRMELQFI